MDQLTYGRSLCAAHMIELKEQRVRNPAVHTGVIAQPRVDELAVSSTIPRVAIYLTALKFGRSMIIFAPIGLLTQLTTRVPSTGYSVLEEESLDRFQLATPGAPLHRRSVLRRCASRVAACGAVVRPEGVEPPSFRLEGGCLIR